MSDTLITVTGVTCAGKTTLQKLLEEKGLGKVVSVTTRDMRSEEVNGIDYEFVDLERFMLLDRNNSFVEKINSGNSQRYGITRESVQKALKDGNGTAVVVLTPSGVDQIKESYSEDSSIRVVSVYLEADEDLVFERLLMRYMHDTKGNMKTYARRMSQLHTELNTFKTDREYDIYLPIMDNDLSDKGFVSIMDNLYTLLSKLDIPFNQLSNSLIEEETNKEISSKLKSGLLEVSKKIFDFIIPSFRWRKMDKLEVLRFHLYPLDDWADLELRFLGEWFSFREIFPFVPVKLISSKSN